MSSQIPSTSPMARTLGQNAFQNRIANRPRPPPGLPARSSASRPASALPAGGGPPAAEEPPDEKGLGPLISMTDHLLAQPVGDLAGELGDRRRVDPARPRDRHREFLKHPAGGAAQ